MANDRPGLCPIPRMPATVMSAEQYRALLAQGAEAPKSNSEFPYAVPRDPTQRDLEGLAALVYGAYDPNIK